jgi:hypothetical protein
MADPRHEPVDKSSYSGTMIASPDPAGGDLMPIIHSQRATAFDHAIPSIVPSDVPAMSDDECLARLARAVEDHDAGQLDEVARLIARLVVPIE